MTDALVLDDSAHFADWERQISTANACSRPIRLRGRITAVDLETGETATAYSTDTEPGRVLHVACGNRRESACPSCSAIYKRDARQLVRSGLTGGKGIPESVAEHPCVFATVTAPSFGPVHARREVSGKGQLCRPRRDAPSASARTAAISPARSATTRMTPGWAVRCAPTATTTSQRSCSTPALTTCGAALPPTCPAGSPA